MLMMSMGRARKAQVDAGAYAALCPPTGSRAHAGNARRGGSGVGDPATRPIVEPLKWDRVGVASSPPRRTDFHGNA